MLARHRIAFSHVIYSSGLFALTLAFAAIAIVILLLRFAAEPEPLKVAAGPADGFDAKLMTSIARHMGRSDRLKLTVLATESSAANAKAIESGKADLAVIRPDVAVPPHGATIAVLYADVAVLAAAPAAGIRKVGDLAKKRIGVVPATSANFALLDAILEQYKVASASVGHISLKPEDLTAEVKKQADALLIVAPLHDPLTAQALAAIGTDKRAAVIVPIETAEGMAARDGRYQKTDITAGYFRGAPPLPKEDAVTLAMPIRLEAGQNLPDETVTTLTKRLFGMRRAVEADLATVALIEKPDTEKSAADTPHPGAAAYYDNNEKSFMDRYGDWIYISAMGFSGVISALTGLVGLLRRRARQAALTLIDRLSTVKLEAHRSLDVARLKHLETEVEELSTLGVRFAREHDFDSDGLTALRMAIDEARLAIREQYAKLSAQPLLAHAPLIAPPAND